MAIVEASLKWYLSGATSDGAAQTNPANSTGGFRSASTWASGTDNNLFDDISGAEASAGDVEYRCFFVKNEHGSLSLTTAKFFLNTTTGNASNTVAFAVEMPASDDSTGSVQTVADESSAPTVNAGSCSDWSTATTYASGVAVNQGAHDTELSDTEIAAIWLKRTVSAGAAAAAAVTVTVAWQGDSAA